jgi:cellulose synthase/poly-beta-1,6-N-acetylglucosamine synthase-like glycosyltransferase
VNTLAAIMGVVALAACGYYLLLFGIAVLARRRARRRPLRAAAQDVLVVVVVPARDEALVIQRTVERVQQLDGAPLLLVVDDGSTDATSELACAAADPARTMVLRRDPPEAGTGKGAVLNAAAEHVGRLVRSGDPRFGGRSTERVALCILDADGWLDHDAIPRVLPNFDDPRVAGVQVSVRMWNARAGFLARMQDIEFVAYGHLFQTARSAIGSALMGGNGQFMRLSAIEQLGPRPWSDCLTEDLDIGLRLVRRGWQLRACPSVHVAQQALVEPRRFVRQRARWVHGHLSCWRHVAPIWNPLVDQPIRARADLTLHLLLGSYGLLAAAQLVVLGALAIGGLAWQDLPTLGPPVVSAGVVVAVMLLPIAIVATTYQRHAEARVPLPALAGVLVAYGAYHYLWSVPATAVALARIVTRRTQWTKTARSAISAHDLAADAVAIGGRR